MTNIIKGNEVFSYDLENFSEELKKFIDLKCDNSIETLDFVYRSITQIKKCIDSNERMKAARKLYFLASKLKKLNKN